MAREFPRTRRPRSSFEAARAGGELVPLPASGSPTSASPSKGLTAHAGNNPQDGRNANVAAMRPCARRLRARRQDPRHDGQSRPHPRRHGRQHHLRPRRSDARPALLERRGRPRTHLEDPRARRKDLGRGVTQTVERQSYSPAMPLSENTRALVEKITDAASKRALTPGGSSTPAAPPTANHMAEPASPSSTARPRRRRLGS